jgi:hypothetical protein
MKTEPPPRHHEEGEPPPESLIHHQEPTLLEQWFRRNLQRGWSFWATVALVAAGAAAVVMLVQRISGPNQSGVKAWTELASVVSAPSSMSPFGPDPNAGLPDRLKVIADDYEDTAAGRWARLRAASLLLNEGSTELATTRRSAGAGKIVEADELFNQLYELAEQKEGPLDRLAVNLGLAQNLDGRALKRMAALGMARAAEARMGLDADDTDHASLEDVLALYDRVIEEFPDTPEAEQAEAQRRRLQRSDSIAFYEQLARFDPNASIPGAPSMPGIDLAPGGSSPLQDLLGLPPSGSPGGGGLPGMTIPGLPGGSPLGSGLPSAPSIDLSAPDDSADMPAPVPIPEVTPAAEPAAAPLPVEPEPAPAGSEPSPSPTAESPRVPDDPFGSSPATPPTPTADPPPAPEPEPTPAEVPAPGGLPESVFPSGGPNG